MNSFEAGLDEMEAQRTMDMSRDQQEMTLIYKGGRTLSSRGSTQNGQDDAKPPTVDTKYLPELSELYNVPGESAAMNLDILCAMRAGNIEFLEKNMKSLKTPVACFKNYKGDSILHIAAAFGHHELVKSIVSKYPSLLLEPNWNGQIPLHVAAGAGHSAVVKALIESITYLSTKLVEKTRERLNPYVLRDQNGDTPLHLALIAFLMYQQRYEYLQPFTHRHSFIGWKTISFSDAYKGLNETAVCLVGADNSASFLANKDGVSPLYLSVEAGNVLLVNEMLNHPSNIHGNTSEPASQFMQLEGRKSLVHAALKSKNTEVLDIILKKYPSLVNERDEEGRSSLSAGASIGFYKGFCMLLDTSSPTIFDWDDDGSCPIHLAVEKGHLDVFDKLIELFPDSVEQLNNKGQNIFHIVAKTGKVKFLARFPKINNSKRLLEEQDVDGNTPLHLATIHWRPRTLQRLYEFFPIKKNVMNVQNVDGLRPLDIAEKHLQPNYVFRERMTLMLLLSIQRPRGIYWLPTSGMTLRSRTDKVVAGGKYKELIQVLLVVAALVTTVSFAAGFTMPGGFESSGKKAGMAILVKDQNLNIFLIYDSMAMFSSIVAIVALIWAQLGDQELADKMFHLALPSLFVALGFMSCAFYYGVEATIKPNSSLGLIVQIVFYLFFYGTVLLLTPFVIPQILGNRILKRLTYVYLLGLLSLVNENDDEKNYTVG